MANATCEVTWLIALLKDFGINGLTPVPLYCDNTSALHTAENPILHERTKHIEIDCHLIRDKIYASQILPLHIPTSQQPADLLTKPLTSAHLQFLLGKLGVLNIFSPSNLREDIEVSGTSIDSSLYLAPKEGSRECSRQGRAHSSSNTTQEYSKASG